MATKLESLNGVRVQRMVRELDELQKRVGGREIEMHSQPRSMPVRYRNSVYVRGDERDGYSTCVASGHGGTMAAALSRAISQWAKRPNEKLTDSRRE
jgi:hypothetical protein